MGENDGGYLAALQASNWVGKNVKPTGHVVPNSCSVECPACGVTAIFATPNLAIRSGDTTAGWAAKCPGRLEFLSFAAFYESGVTPGNRATPYLIIYSSKDSCIHQPKDFGEEVPERIRVAFVSAVRSYNAKNYEASIVMSRRVLEGIFKLRPNAPIGKDLSALIKDAGQGSEVGEILVRLSNAIREGGNLAAHFDLRKDPDQQKAEYIVALVEYLIEYFYVLPTHLNSLEK